MNGYCAAAVLSISIVVASASAPQGSGRKRNHSDWVVVKKWNALHIGPSRETVKDLSACEKKAEGHTQFSFNENSHHCYVSDSKTWGGSSNDHVTSGCLKDVTGCGQQPSPPGPEPTPSPPRPSPIPTPGPTPPGPSPGPTPPVYDGQIRQEGNGLQSAYMIVPPGGSDNHAATIEMLPDGSLVAAWFSGAHEQASGCAIAVSRLSSGSTAWTKSTIVSQESKKTNQNPLLFYDAKTKILHLWHTHADADSGEGEAEVFHLSSKDEGLTWSEPKQYFDRKGIFIRNRIIRRKDDTLLWPYYSTSGHWVNGKVPVFAWSDSATVPESGSGWTVKEMDKSGNDLEQPTCWRQPHETSTIECYFRDCGAESIYHAESTDEGKSFSKPTKTKLPNPDSGIEAYPLKNGDIVLAYNPTHGKSNGGGRDPLSAGISSDDGKTWKSRKIQDGPTGAPSVGSNEFSYPTVLQTPDGVIHVMYSYAPKGQPRTIKYVRFTEDWVTSHPDSDVVVV